MTMAMFLMVFDAVVIAAPISLQVLMLPFLCLNFTPSHFIYLRIWLFTPGYVLVTRFNVYYGKFAYTIARVNRILTNSFHLLVWCSRLWVFLDYDKKSFGFLYSFNCNQTTSLRLRFVNRTHVHVKRVYFSLSQSNLFVRCQSDLFQVTFLSRWYSFNEFNEYDNLNYSSCSSVFFSVSILSLVHRKKSRESTSDAHLETEGKKEIYK